MPSKLGEPGNGEDLVCVVCRELTTSDLLKDAALCMIAFVQKLALAGAKVTLLWIPAGHPKPEEIEDAVSYYRDNFSINVVLYDHAKGLTYQNTAPTHLSLGLYTYLKRNNYSAVYIPLEDGLAYYTLLGRETGV